MAIVYWSFPPKYTLLSKKVSSSMKRLHSSALLSDDPATGKLPSSNMRLFRRSPHPDITVSLDSPVSFGEYPNQLVEGPFQPKSSPPNDVSFDSISLTKYRIGQ